MIPLEPYLCGKGADREGELPPHPKPLPFPGLDEAAWVSAEPPGCPFL